MALEAEFKFFRENQEALVLKYDGKYLVIRGTEVAGVFDEKIEAFKDASSKYPAGTFLIQHCISGQDAYTQTFHSRVIFN